MKEKVNLEEYNPIDEYDEKYLVNKDGKIYNAEKKFFLKINVSKNCEYVKLSKKVQSVPNIMADTFLKKRKNDTKIIHKNGDLLNNNLNNLKWGTMKDYQKMQMKINKKNMPKEIAKEYKKIPGFDGFYYINKEGKVYSLYVNDFMTPYLTSSDYSAVVLHEKTNLVHRLVAKTFIPKVENKDIVNHIDGNKLNNNVDNLEWSDYAENNKHYHALGLQGKNKTLGDYKYYQLDDDKNVIAEFDSITKIKDKINISHSWISKAAKGEDTKVGGYYWKREKIDHYNKYKDEIWKPTNTKTDIDEFVEVSNYGRVRNKNTNHLYKTNTLNQYENINIKNGNTKRPLKIHRLVAQSFLKNEAGEKAHVNHKDKNIINNHVDNLEWLNPKEHMLKDHAVSVTEVCEDGTVRVHNSIVEAGQARNVNPGQISSVIASKGRCRKSYWFRTKEYDKK